MPRRRHFAVATLPESVDYTDKDRDTLRPRLIALVKSVFATSSSTRSRSAARWWPSRTSASAPRQASSARCRSIPVLAESLARWLASGWEGMMGRAPTPDDLLLPLPPEHSIRRRNNPEAEPMRSRTYCFKRLRYDLAVIGLRPGPFTHGAATLADFRSRPTTSCRLGGVPFRQVQHGRQPGFRSLGGRSLTNL